MENEIIYKKRFFLNWLPRIRAALRKLSFPDGAMREATNRKNPITCVAFCKNIPIGWAIISKANNRFFARGTISVYVKENFRRKGIGSVLINKINNKTAKRVIAYDKQSFCFWSKIYKPLILIKSGNINV